MLKKSFCLFVLLIIVFGCQKQQEIVKIESETNYITFSNIDKAKEITSGANTKVAIIDWQFDINGEGAKYLNPKSFVPDEPIGELKPWHGEWMAEIVHLITPDAKIIPIRARSLNKKEYEEYLIKGIYYAAELGAVAVTSSMGPLGQSEELDKAIEFAEEHGTIFINVHPEYYLNDSSKKVLCEAGACNEKIIHTGIVSVPDYEVEPEANRDIYTWAYSIDPVYKDGWGYSNGPPVVAGVIALQAGFNYRRNQGFNF